MSANVQAALDAAGKVVKKQKICASKVEENVDKLLQLVSAAAQAQQSGAGAGTAVSQLLAEAERLGLTKDMNTQTKELHATITKLSKSLDKAFDEQLDVCKALRAIKFDQQTLNQVIAEHLYREGRFELGEQFVAEAHIPDPQRIKQPYVAMHHVLREIRAQNLQPALAWAQEHRHQLSQDGEPSSFEFRLHALNFTNLLTQQGQSAALRYARAHFTPFQTRHLPEIKKLMACMVFANKAAAENPYRDLMSVGQWEEVAREFTRQACSLMGQAYESPLAVAVAAGSVALPALLKLACVMERNGQDLSSCEQLPIELELGPEFVFHSIFACPVSREQSTPENPPMLLPCNHVLCEQSILKIAKSRTRVFKCPYCPMEARADNVRPLIFSDVV